MLDSYIFRTAHVLVEYLPYQGSSRTKHLPPQQMPGNKHHPPSPSQSSSPSPSLHQRIHLTNTTLLYAQHCHQYCNHSYFHHRHSYTGTVTITVTVTVTNINTNINTTNLLNSSSSSSPNRLPLRAAQTHCVEYIYLHILNGKYCACMTTSIIIPTI